MRLYYDSCVVRYMVDDGITSIKGYILSSQKKELPPYYLQAFLSRGGKVHYFKSKIRSVDNQFFLLNPSFTIIMTNDKVLRHKLQRACYKVFSYSHRRHDTLYFSAAIQGII